MNVGEVRIAEDSDFSLLKVSLNFIFNFMTMIIMSSLCRFSSPGVMAGRRSSALVPLRSGQGQQKTAISGENLLERP